MDFFGFVASLVASLAWPLAAVAIAIIFRSEWADLINRIRKAKAGPVEISADAREKFVDEIVQAAPPTATGGTASFTLSAFDARVVAESNTAELVQRTIDQMRNAGTVKELADGVLRYVGLRSVPGLRNLSPERISLEKELFGAVLELQSLRAAGTIAYSSELSDAVQRIDQFWTNPEQLSDPMVAETTTAIQRVVAGMKA